MPPKKGNIKWSDEKKKIAELVQLGKGDEDIAAETKSSITMVKTVRLALEKGQLPPGQQAPGGLIEAPKDLGQEKKKELAAAYVTFKPVAITCQYTPMMFIAQQAAVEQWGWTPDMRFEDFVDTILYHFFKDRGLTLQGYIVDAEVEGVNPSLESKS